MMEYGKCKYYNTDGINRRDRQEPDGINRRDRSGHPKCGFYLKRDLRY